MQSAAGSGCEMMLSDPCCGCSEGEARGHFAVSWHRKVLRRKQAPGAGHVPMSQ
jgi:hypothetical protein